MPLGVEDPSLARRAIAGLKSAGGNVVGALERPGVPIQSATFTPGTYSPGAAAVNAVLSFGAGVRQAANFRASLAAHRVDQAYKQAQTEHTIAETRRLNAPAADTYSFTTPGRPGEPLPNGVAGPVQDVPGHTYSGLTGEQAASLDLRANPAAKDPATLTPFQKATIQHWGQVEGARQSLAGKMSAVNFQERGLDTEDQQNAGRAKTAAAQTADALQRSALLENRQALLSLGITPESIANLSGPEKQRLITTQAQAYRDQLERRFVNESTQMTAGRRQRLQSAMPGMGGVDLGVGAQDTGPSPMDALIEALSR